MFESPTKYFVLSRRFAILSLDLNNLSEHFRLAERDTIPDYM